MIHNLEDYLERRPEDIIKKCFALSNNFGNDICCYGKNNRDCLKKSNEMELSKNYECPLEAIVPNNCGMAGIYQPNSSDICTKISLVQGFCCYVTLKINNIDSYS